MLGGQGLVDSSKMALLSANYMAHRLYGHYSLRYKNDNGRVAHELLIDFAEFEKPAGLKVADFAKRLQVSTQKKSRRWILSQLRVSGLRFSPTDRLMAHLDVYAYRTYRIRIFRRD
jgi:hypothetical protein